MTTYRVTTTIFAGGGETFDIVATSEADAKAIAKVRVQSMFHHGTIQLSHTETCIEMVEQIDQPAATPIDTTPLTHPYPVGTLVLSIAGELDNNENDEERETGPMALGAVQLVSDFRPTEQGWAYHVLFPNGTYVTIDQGDSIDDPEKYRVYPTPHWIPPA